MFICLGSYDVEKGCHCHCRTKQQLTQSLLCDLLIISFFHSGLELTHQGTSVKGNSLIVKGVVALGSVPSHAGKVRDVDTFLTHSSGGYIYPYCFS